MPIEPDRMETTPRYEIHLCPSGVLCLYVGDNERSKELGRDLSSISIAFRKINQHAGREVWPYYFDADGGWAPG